jgi:hypothetical protein
VLGIWDFFSNKQRTTDHNQLPSTLQGNEKRYCDKFQYPNFRQVCMDIATKKFGICDLEFVIFPATGNRQHFKEMEKRHHP